MPQTVTPVDPGLPTVRAAPVAPDLLRPMADPVAELDRQVAVQIRLGAAALTGLSPEQLRDTVAPLRRMLPDVVGRASGATVSRSCSGDNPVRAAAPSLIWTATWRSSSATGSAIGRSRSGATGTARTVGSPGSTGVTVCGMCTSRPHQRGRLLPGSRPVAGSVPRSVAARMPSWRGDRPRADPPAGPWSDLRGRALRHGRHLDLLRRVRRTVLDPPGRGVPDPRGAVRGLPRDPGARSAGRVAARPPPRGTAARARADHRAGDLRRRRRTGPARSRGRARGCERALCRRHLVQPGARASARLDEAVSYT